MSTHYIARGRRSGAWAGSALLALAVVGGCSAEMSPGGGGTVDDATATSGSAAPPTAEPLPERPVAVDEDGSRLSAAPVEPSETAVADEGEDVLVSLSQVEVVDGEAMSPGEVEGPALRLTLTVENASDLELDTSAAVVNLYYGPDATPANTFEQPGGVPFPAVIPSGRSAQGVFLFAVPEEERDEVRLEIDLAPELQVVVINGDVTTA